jgi:hypothetical protein
MLMGSDMISNRWIEARGLRSHAVSVDGKMQLVAVPHDCKQLCHSFVGPVVKETKVCVGGDDLMLIRQCQLHDTNKKPMACEAYPYCMDKEYEGFSRNSILGPACGYRWDKKKKRYV